MNVNIIKVIGVIIGGTIGGIVSGRIGNYINAKPKSQSQSQSQPHFPSQSLPNSDDNLKNEPKYKNFEEMVQKKYELELEKNISESNVETSVDALYQLYSSEKTDEINDELVESSFTNDALYDNNFYDYYTLMVNK